MNQDVLSEAKRFVARAEAMGVTGNTLDADSLAELNTEMGGRIPAWYIELLTQIPLANIEIAWTSEENGVEIQDAIEWSDVRGMRSESIECYPGIAILKHDYINVGGDAYGSGNAYFMPTNQGLNPPIFQVYHDVSDDADEILKDGIRQIASSLSEFFHRATVSA